mgnify:FL=1|tara:strand:+ start:88 stop:531 length:444 start_codon:yes stop_codon:yes gene_type:complete
MPQVGDLVLKVRQPYASRLVAKVKTCEMRSRSVAKACRQVTPGTWVWFASLQGALPGYDCCVVLGGARFVGEEGPLVPGSVHGEARWKELEPQHTVEGSLKEFGVGMPKGYSSHVWAWQFADAVALEPPAKMADTPYQMGFVKFAPR